MLEQKYSKLQIEATIMKAKDIPFEVLRQTKTTKNYEIIPFTTTYNPNNLDTFLIINQSLILTVL